MALRLVKAACDQIRCLLPCAGPKLKSYFPHHPCFSADWQPIVLSSTEIHLCVTVKKPLNFQQKKLYPALFRSQCKATAECVEP